jgi:hypothetical protein
VDYDNITVSIQIGEGLCSYQLYDNCVSADDPIWDANLPCKRHPYYQFSCNELFRTDVLYIASWECEHFNIQDEKLESELALNEDDFQIKNESKRKSIIINSQVEEISEKINFDYSEILIKNSINVIYYENECLFDLIFYMDESSFGEISVITENNFIRPKKFSEAFLKEGLNILTFNASDIINANQDFGLLLSNENGIVFYKEININKSCSLSLGNRSKVKTNPNPVKDDLQILLDSNCSGIVNIFTIDNRIIRTLNFNNEKEITINTSNYLAGIYYLQLVLDDGTIINNKFVKIN